MRAPHRKCWQLISITWPLLAACQGGDGPDRRQAPVSGPGHVPPASIVVTPAPAGGGTTFLSIACGEFDPAVAAPAPSVSTAVLGCILKDKAGNRVPGASLTDLAATVTLSGGTPAPPTLALTSEDIGWSMSLLLPPAAVAKIAKIAVTGAANGAVFAASTDDASYDGNGDPAFGAAWTRRAGEVLFEQLRLAPGADCNPPPDFDEAQAPPLGFIMPPPAAFLAQPYHIVFYTTDLHRADEGVAAFDQACAAAGELIDQSRAWKAVISTSTSDAADRVVIAGPVFNTWGLLVAKDAADFWNPLSEAEVDGEAPASLPEYVLPASAYPGHNSGILDQCGHADSNLNNDAFTSLDLTFTAAWTGTQAGGALGPSGTCRDWTSSAASDTGGIGDVGAASTDFFNASGVPCDQQGFIVCISQ